MGNPAVVTEVHARWGKRRHNTYCGGRGRTVFIRRPDDWERVECAYCEYAATHDDDEDE
jgi:hypothetical protein